MSQLYIQCKIRLEQSNGELEEEVQKMKYRAH